MGVQYNTIENVPVASFETSWKNESANQPIKSVVAEITPTQDLHGYDYPWPAGGGKNKLKNNGNNGSTGGITWTVNEDGSISLSGTVGESYVHVYINTTNSYQTLGTGDISLVCSATASYNPDITGINFQNDIYADGTYVGTIQRGGVTKSFSGTKIEVGTSRLRIAPGTVIPSGTKFYPSIEIGTAVSSPWNPYSNICPITGRTEATVWRTGKNLLDSTSYSRLQNCTIVDGVVTATVSDTRRQIWPVCQLYDGTKYVRGTERIGEFFSWRFTKTNDVNVIAFGHTGASKDIKIYYPIAHLKDGMEYVFSANVISAIEPFSWDSMMICNSTADYNIFSPYSGTSYPVSWQSEVGTVYGGTVDVVSGVLTVEWATTDLGLYTWNYSESAGAFYCGISTMKYYSSQTPIISALCSAYPNVGKPYLELGDKQLTTNMYGFSNSQKYCIIKDSAYTDAAEFKAAMSGIQFVYALATPQTYQLSGQQIKTLLGLNNVWADSGNIKKLMWQYTIFDLLRVFINGFEITDFIAFGGWQRERGDVDGPEAGRTLDARMHRARVATKMRYNVTCRPLLVEELSSLERLIMPEYVTVKVIGDPYYGTWEKTCYVNNTSSQYLIRKRNGAQWWGGITFPIIEV